MVNIGGSPHDGNSVQDLWYALQEIGAIDESFEADGENAIEVHPQGRQPDGDLRESKYKGASDTFTGELGPDETYTSDWIDTDGYGSIEVFVSAQTRSQTDGLTIEYTDNVQADTPIVQGSTSRTFTEEDAERGFEEFHFATNLDGFRLHYTNNGTSTANDFSVFITLDTRLSLDSADYVGQDALGQTFLRVASERNGNGVKIGDPISLFNDLETVNRETIVDLSSSFGTSVVNDEIDRVGSGTITQDPDPSTGEIELSTGTTPDSEIDVRSAEYGRYTPGYSAHAGMGIRIPTLPDEGRLEWGYFDENNGFLWGYDGETDEFFIARKADGNIVQRVNEVDFNRTEYRDVFKRDFSLSDGQIFQIDFSWYGYGIVLFKIVDQIPDDADGASVPRQETTVLHALTVRGETSTSDPNQPLRVRALNGANGDDNRIRFGGRQFSVSGNLSSNKRITGQTRFDFTVQDSVWTFIQSWRRKDPLTTANAKSTIEGIDFGIDQTVRVALVIEPNIANTNYQVPDLIPDNETQLEYSNTGDFNGIDGGTKIWEGSVRVGQNEKGVNLEPDVNVSLGQGKEVVLIAQCDRSSGNADMTMRFQEDF